MPRAYSPDGRYIYVLSNRGSETLRLWRGEVATGAWKPITAESDDLESFALSPDGRTIAAVFDSTDEQSRRASRREHFQGSLGSEASGRTTRPAPPDVAARQHRGGVLAFVPANIRRRVFGERKNRCSRAVDEERIRRVRSRLVARTGNRQLEELRRAHDFGILLPPARAIHWPPARHHQHPWRSRRIGFARTPEISGAQRVSC